MHPSTLRRLSLLALLIAGTAAASSWVVGYTRILKDGTTLSIDGHRDGKVRLTLEDHANTLPAPKKIAVDLTAHEAQELARILMATSNDGEKSFEELAEESARKTDAHFCLRAVNEWQKKAFCREPGK